MNAVRWHRPSSAHHQSISHSQTALQPCSVCIHALLLTTADVKTHHILLVRRGSCHSINVFKCTILLYYVHVYILPRLECGSDIQKAIKTNDLWLSIEVGFFLCHRNRKMIFYKTRAEMVYQEQVNQPSDRRGETNAGHVEYCHHNRSNVVEIYTVSIMIKVW